MEVLGQGLMAIGVAIEGFAAACAFVAIAGIAAGTFLIYMDKTTVTELASVFRRKDGLKLR